MEKSCLDRILCSQRLQQLLPRAIDRGNRRESWIRRSHFLLNGFVLFRIDCPDMVLEDIVVVSGIRDLHGAVGFLGEVASARCE